MAILKVAQLGNPVLRNGAEPIPPDKIKSPEIQKLIKDMVDTMHDHAGVGLAATQVHEPRQLLVIEATANPRYPESPEIPLTVLINPKIEKFSSEMEEDWEGCLSLPDLWGVVKRAKSITVSALDIDGKPVKIEADQFLARVIQHEIDHLYGKVFVDRMSDLSSLSFGRERMRYAEKSDDDTSDSGATI